MLSINGLFGPTLSSVLIRDKGLPRVTFNLVLSVSQCTLYSRDSFFNMLKILVTGGAGFIGSAVVRHIIRDTRDAVINLDKLTYAGNLESLADVSTSERYAFEQVDICNRAELDLVFAQHQPDAVMHLAAESHVDRSITGPADFIETNIVGSYMLLEAARAYWNGLDEVRKAAFRFHPISTDEVYGDLPHPDEVAAGEPLPLFTETTPYAPSSLYSASKASSDHLVRAWRRTYGLPTIVTNCSNNYGPYHFPEKLIPLVILNALDGKPLPVYGKGDQIRDWLYVEDHARALQGGNHRRGRRDLQHRWSQREAESGGGTYHLRFAGRDGAESGLLPRSNHLCSGSSRSRSPLCHRCQQDEQ